jgi:pyruvate,water dikinase
VNDTAARHRTPESLGRDRSGGPSGRDGGEDSSPLIRWFDEIDRSVVSLVGGKGANLGELARAGLPVPPGFIVTVDAYSEFYAENRLAEQVSPVLARLNADDPTSLAETSRRSRARGAAHGALR